MIKGNKIVRFCLGVVLIVAFVVASAILTIHDPLFSDPYATVVYDRNGSLLGGRIATDEQWRFPFSNKIPTKFESAIINYEDRFFYSHPGFNPVSIFHALAENIKAGKVIRGGSTISMQLIRLSRKGKPRTIYEKLVELYYALALELRYSKKEILELYCAHAPFGGNVVGIDAASWRYFGHDKSTLSWAEAATLAVLPNAPGMIHPGRNRKQLMFKRDFLLGRLLKEHIIDSMTYQLALIEDLPLHPKALPNEAAHFVEYIKQHQKGKSIQSSIDLALQQKLNDLVATHQQRLTANQIKHIAVLLIEPKTKEVLAYIGNSRAIQNAKAGHDVDMIHARRSTGSILKPLLYAAMIESGQLLPNALIPDIPSYYENYHPQNYTQSFEGAVPASHALSRSLNVPSIYMLRDYGITRFHQLLPKVGIHSFNKPASHYGLTMILGGGEASLWEITSMYAGMAKTLLDYDLNYGKYNENAYAEPIFSMGQANKAYRDLAVSVPLHAASIWQTYQSLYEVQRPLTEEGWSYFSSAKKVAWKTGTSYGFRDAWAVGTTPDYVVGVWVGNADGEGRTGLVGSKAAAPLLFDVVNALDEKQEFIPPYDELRVLKVCRQSGFQASRHCPDIDSVMSYEKGILSPQCTYHQSIFTDKAHQFRLSQACASVDEMDKISWFVLPAVQEWYYRKSHPDYASMPSYKTDCQPDGELPNIAFIYPVNNTKIFVPMGVSGKKQQIVFEISHRKPRQNVYWHIDQTYLASTNGNHQFAFIPESGKHVITVTDANGESATVRFEVVN